MKKIKVMVAEDHKMYREIIAESIVKLSNRIEVIGVAENGTVLMGLLKNILPDIVILDLNMPEMDGWKVLEIFKENFPGIKTIIFSGEYSEYDVILAVLSGARSFIDKLKGEPKDLARAIEDVFDFGYYFNHLVAKEVILTLNSNKQISFLSGDQKFSEREIEITKLICKGMEVKEIAANLNISGATVKYHKGNVYAKTESKTNMDLLKYAISRGIYNVPAPKLKLNLKKKG